ncbi:MAG: hypothetical protein FJ102_07710 [Deltaproteobacteria bacterium]|nr:hypothetical protein [Deltaproteobacteria bacterium]
MRFDPRRRLDRPLPGARITEERTLRIHVSENRPSPPCPVPARDEKELSKIDTRPSRKRVEAGPNAPQLIRLVRYPFALATVRPRRQVVLEARRSAEARAEARAPLGHPMREAVAEREEVRSTRAASSRAELGRPRAFAPRTSALVVVPPLLEDDS